MLALKSVIVTWKNWRCDLFLSCQGKMLSVEEYGQSKWLAHMRASAFLGCFAWPISSFELIITVNVDFFEPFSIDLISQET